VLILLQHDFTSALVIFHLLVLIVHLFVVEKLISQQKNINILLWPTVANAVLHCSTLLPISFCLVLFF